MMDPSEMEKEQELKLKKEEEKKGKVGEGVSPQFTRFAFFLLQRAVKLASGDVVLYAQLMQHYFTWSDCLE